MAIKVLLVATAAVMAAPLATSAETINPAQVIAQKFSDASEEKPLPAQRSFAVPGPDYELEMLDRARIEELERRLQEAQAIAARSAEVTAAPSGPNPMAKTDPAPVAKLAALPSEPSAQPTISRSEPSGSVASVATILLVLDPDGTAGGFKPDPIICIDNRCWLSNGITAPAREISRNEAVALRGTDELTTGSCSGKSGCVYRNVEIDPAARIDVVQVGEGGGASLGAYTVAPDKSCRKDGDSLACDNGLATQNFRIWAVPEAVAEGMGASNLENAVAEGLPETNVSFASDK